MTQLYLMRTHMIHHLYPPAYHLNTEEQSLIPFLLQLSSLTPSNHLQPPASSSNPPGEDRAFQQTWPDQTIVFARILHLQPPPLSDPGWWAVGRGETNIGEALSCNMVNPRHPKTRSDLLVLGTGS